MTFDCYGTLIDWESGITDTFLGLWPGADAAVLLARYHEIEPNVQRGSDAPYADVLAETLRSVAGAEGLPLSDDDTDALARSLPRWPPFPEVPAALHELRTRGWRLAVLSNTDPELLDASISNIGVEIDKRITVREAGSYKPAHGHWQRFFDVTSADPAQHAHVAASLFHDIAPCAELGLRCVWINRLGERSDLARNAELTDLTLLADVLDEL